MKRSFFVISLVFFAFVSQTQAQKKRKPTLPAKPSVRVSETPKTAIVVDERLAILRIQPSLYADTIQRMRTGRILTISGSKQVDGVTFYRAVVPPKNFGWVQA